MSAVEIIALCLVAIILFVLGCTKKHKPVKAIHRDSFIPTDYSVPENTYVDGCICGECGLVGERYDVGPYNSACPRCGDTGYKEEILGRWNGSEYEVKEKEKPEQSFLHE